MDRNFLPKINIQSTFGLTHLPIASSYKQSTNGFPREDEDSFNVINRMVAPLTNGEQYNIYKFITDLKQDLGILNLSDMFDCLYVFTSATVSDCYINWAQPGFYDISLIGTIGNAVGNILWTQGQGFNSTSTGNIVSTLNTGFNPAIATASNFSGYLTPTGATKSTVQFSGSYGIYVSKGTLGSQAQFEFGSSTSTGNGTLLGVWSNQNNNIYYSCMSATLRQPQGGVGYSMATWQNGGLYSISRKNTVLESYFNGTIYEVVGNGTNAVSANIDHGPFTICNPNIGNQVGLSVSTNSSLASVNRVAFAYVGSSEIKSDIIYRRLMEYLRNSGYVNGLPK